MADFTHFVPLWPGTPGVNQQDIWNNFYSWHLVIRLQELELVFGHTDERTDHFVTPEAYLTTFIVSEIFWFVAVSIWPLGANPKCPRDPRGSGVTPNAFLSPLKHTWQLLLAKFFDLLKFQFDSRGPPRTVQQNGVMGLLSCDFPKIFKMCSKWLLGLNNDV